VEVVVLKFDSAVVVANPYKKNTSKTKREVEKFLRGHGVKISKKGKVLITIGGDGTLLYNKDIYDKPIFGIGGRDSFICQAKFWNWRKKLAKLLEGFEFEERSMLSCSVKGKKFENALNEVCLRSISYRLLELELVAGEKKHEFGADGMIFSTPTGSTAYAYSCGGVELPVHAKKYEAVAIAPYRRKFSHILIPENTKSILKVKGTDKPQLIIDGQRKHVHYLPKQCVLTVSKSSRKVRLVKV